MTISEKLQVIAENELKVFDAGYRKSLKVIDSQSNTLAAIIQSEETDITIPDGITVIREYLFYRHPVTGITFPASVTKVERAAFHTATNCLVYDFSKCTVVPTLDNTSAFTGINANAKIKVPSDLYNEWIAATNWATYASYIEATMTGVVAPTNDSTESVTVNTSFYPNMGFYFSDNLTAGTRYISHTWLDYDTETTREYEFDSDEVASLLTIDDQFTPDTFEQDGYTVYGDYYFGTMTFLRTGTYRIYQKYYDAAGNEYTTGSYIFEVT